MLWLKSRGEAGLGLVAVALSVARVAGMDFGKGRAVGGRMMPSCQSKSPSPGPRQFRPGPVHREAWLKPGSQWLPSLQMEPRRQIGALLNETQARSQSCWAKSKNKFLPDIKSNQEPLPHCPSPACLLSFPCAVSCCAVTPDLASLASCFRLQTTDRQATGQLVAQAPPPPPPQL